jgi:hypothetical protein
MEFSKKLAVFVCAVFAFVIGFLAYTYLFKGNVSNDLLSTISTPFMVVVSGYFAKAGVENYTKIKGGQ